ncbi:MAG: LacI family DNA-binding transcriptional regulator [Ruminiclostridium sp.]
MNISDIARLAGVSKATVSRYLNNGYVSAEKREIIRKIIEQNDYTPLMSARNLRSGQNNLIGVIIPRLSSESVARMVDGVSEVISGAGFNMVLGITDLSQEKELDFLKIFRGNTVCGMIYIATEITRKNREILSAYNKPVVIVGQKSGEFDCVFHDDFGGAYGAVKHIIGCGCKKIGFIGVPMRDKAAGRDRFEGYARAMEESGLPVSSRLTYEGEFSLESGYAGAERLFKGSARPDGLFCATDTIAIGAMQYCFSHNIEVGRDVKIAAVGDSKMSKAVNPALTSVHLFYKTAGREAAQLVMNRLADPDGAPKSVELGYRLMERASTAV